MSNCVNFNSPDVVKLAGELNVSPAVAAAKIGLYQDKNGLDKFPTVDELQQSNNINYQKNQTNSNEGIIASEKTIRDLAAKIADRIGMKVTFESDRSKDYKGKIENNIAYVNLAYATLDTPIHEILGHPIIRAIKNKELYQNLLKELETDKGKEVLDRIKRDYTNKTDKYDPFEGEKISDEEYNNIQTEEVKTDSDEYLWRDFYEKRIGNKVYTIQKGEDANLNSARAYTLPTYSLEEQQEEAIVELLGLMTAEKLDNVKDGKLISLLKRLLKEMKQFIRSLINQKEIEIDKLPDNMTLGDLSDLLAYSNSKLILPGYEVEYTTPDNMKFKTYQEASNHISELAKNVKDVDLDDIKINNQSNYQTFVVVNETTYEKEEFDTVEEAEEYKNEAEYEDIVGTKFTIRTIEKKPDLVNFIEKNKEYEQSKEIIEEWKKVNNIQYNSEEIYSRGQEFSSVVGAYSQFDVNLMMQNLLSHIEDNEKAGGKFAISAYTKPIDKQIGHLEGGGGKIKFKLYPKSNDILWAANTDVYSGSVWDASEKVNKDKKSELLGVSYTKYPSLSNVSTVQPNLASIVDNLAHHHNELGITLTGNNFRLEYDEDIPYTTKKIIDGINKILDQKYGKLVKPEINKEDKNRIEINNLKQQLQQLLDQEEELYATTDFESIDSKSAQNLANKIQDVRNNITILAKDNRNKGIQPTQTNETLKESIDSIKIKYDDNIEDTDNMGSYGYEVNGVRYVKSDDGTYLKRMNISEKFIEITEEEYENNKPKSEISKKEYTSQALINTKIAALKEVAKKQPRSLIRSEVKPISQARQPLSYFEDDMLFQKIPSKDLSEFESDENESIFSESVKEPVKVKEDNFEVNKRLLFGNEKDTNKSFTAKEVLQNIIDFDLNLSDAGINLVFKSMNILNLAKTRVKIISQERFDELTKGSEGEGTAVMAYNYDAGNVIYITENSLKMFNKEQILESFIHEVAHNLSIKALINPVTFEEHEFHDLIFKAFEQYKYLGKTLNGSGSYGFTNEKEFVAELYSNAEFRKEIQDLEKGFWKKFVDGVRLLFGLKRTSDNSELINSVLLIESVEKFIENNTTADESVFKNDYSNSFNNVLFKKVKDIKDADTYELETIDKKAEHLVNKAKSKVAELINRTKASDKEKAGEFLEEFKKLEKELETLSSLNKWKAITGYMVSFKSAIDKLNTLLENKFKVKEVTFNGVKYTKVKNLDAFKSEKGEFIIPEDQKSKIDKDFFETNNFIVDSNLYNEIENEGIKSFSNKDYLELANNYDEYLASYDLLEDIKKLIGDTVKDYTLSREDKLEIKEIKNKIIELSEPHKELTDRIKVLRNDSAIKLFSDPSNNKKVTTKWRNKLSLEYNKLKNPTQSRDEWIGYHMSNTHAEEIKKDLEDAARKIIENPYTDISSYVKNWMDLLNTNSPLINMIANIVGKMRDSILKEITAVNFKISDIFDEYSKFNNSTSMSKKYGNLLELNESEDTYYLKGKYSIKFKEEYNKMLNSLLEKNKDVEDYDYKKDVEYKKWIKENTTKDKLSQTIPHSKYLNKPLNPAEEKALDFFRTQTKSNHELNYKGRGGLYSTFFGAEYYKLPSKTKSDGERTLEGDIKGQIKDKWTDLKETKVDDIHYGEAFDSKGGELKRVKINFRGKLESKNQSLDLFTVYRAEEANAISFKHRSANENKLKLFLDIAKNKDYKTKSLITRKWAMNIFAKEEVQGQTFSGEQSNEYAKIKGILETALYDITSYSEVKLAGMDVNKITAKVNGAAAFIGMTLNIGSGAVNFLNGQTMMAMLRIGGNYINKSNLSKSEVDYVANLPEIMADIGRPVKKSFDNQMLNMFDIIGGVHINKQDFMNNSTVKEMMSLHNTNFINESVEHGLNCILTRAVLRSIPVMNKNHKYIDKEGKETTEDKAASIFDMLYMDKDGILKTKEYFTYSKFNLVDDYHKTGKQSINYLLKKNVENLYGVYDSNMKAEISKNWYGKLLMMFKGFFLSQMEYRYKGLRTANKAKDELDDEDLTFNNAEQEFTEGIYVTAVRTFYPLLRHLNLQMTKENFKNLSDYEKANLRQVFFEVSMTAILLPLLGAMMAANAGDDDDELYFLLFAFRRLESEMSQFRNIAELNRMISNPIAANRFLQNGFTVVNDIFTPINFQPEKNESYFDWLSENTKKQNVLLHHAFQLAPGKSLFMNTYKQRYSLIDK